MLKQITTKLKIKKIHSSAKLPKQQTFGSVGYDVYSVEDVIVGPGVVTVVRTGLSMEPPPWYHIELYARSSFGKEGIILANGVGIIDKDYRGEVKLLLSKITPHRKLLKKGTRVGQLIVRKSHFPEIEEVEILNDTERGVGGFGSTGKR
jgi:dUTP pyrophosphatase